MKKPSEIVGPAFEDALAEVVTGFKAEHAAGAPPARLKRLLVDGRQRILEAVGDACLSMPRRDRRIARSMLGREMPKLIDAEFNQIIAELDVKAEMDAMRGTA